MPSLYEEIKSIDADEEDDKAMGDVPAATLSQNDDVRAPGPSRPHLHLRRERYDQS